MKIVNHSPTPIQPAEKLQLERADRAERALPTADGVSLSADARWVNAIKEEVRHEPEIRTGLVQQTRDAIAAGTWESSVDLDTLVTNFLADL